MSPLAGVRVLSATVYLAGPFLSMTLARFGAEALLADPRNAGTNGHSQHPAELRREMLERLATSGACGVVRARSIGDCCRRPCGRHLTA
jgi:crotonobetainyl-CoA:carnitine CoA-transferase CaiB-like acyl-CoA transferase